jgi:hypothetical protein
VPPVVHKGMMVSLYFNPRETQDLITGLATDETVFHSFKIDNTKVDIPGLNF